MPAPAAAFTAGTPDDVAPTVDQLLGCGAAEGRVRAALTAVHRAAFSGPSHFTRASPLTLGFTSYRPELADRSTSNGSLYLTSTGLLALSLPASGFF